MRRGLLFTLLSLLALSCGGVFAIEAECTNAESDVPFIIEDDNNLATWKYDWDTSVVGSGVTGFDTGHLKMENINAASANYAMYTTNQFNEWRMDMYANLSLKPISTSSVNEGADNYANLYVTFFIEFEDIKAISNPSSAACPWVQNKGWMSVCFERVARENKISLIINETFDGSGANRYYLAEKGSSIDFTDNEYHYYSIDVTSTRSVNPDKRRPKEEGTTISIYVDGVKQISFFQSNYYSSNTKGKQEVVDFANTTGYVGFWASSNYSGSQNTATTGILVDIPAIQFTSYDNVSDKSLAKPFTKCAVPSYEVESVLYSPASSYQVNDEMELRMSDMFSYKGEEKLEYKAFDKDGNPIGEMMNGFFVWTPTVVTTETDPYQVNFVATAKGTTKSATNTVRFNIVEPTKEEENNPTQKTNYGLIIGLSVGGGVLLIGIAVGLIIYFNYKKKHRYDDVDE